MTGVYREMSEMASRTPNMPPDSPITTSTTPLLRAVVGPYTIDTVHAMGTQLQSRRHWWWWGGLIPRRCRVLLWSRWMTAISGPLPLSGGVVFGESHDEGANNHLSAVAMCRAYAEGDLWERTEEEPVE